MLNQTIIRYGTRGSQLARRQSQLVIDALHAKFPDLQFEERIISTQGDRDKKSSIHHIGGKGVFVKEIERALLDCRIDFAIHSLKDMQSQELEGTCLPAYLKREDSRDVLIMNQARSIDELKEGAVIGTGSLRRRIQIQALYPHLRFVEHRGNVETRIQKMYDLGLDGIVLAHAGLIRLGYDLSTSDLNYHLFSVEDVIPSVGQAVLACQCRDDDAKMIEILQVINDEKTQTCAEAERSYLRCFGVDCRYPIGAYCKYIDQRTIQLQGMWGSQDLTFMTVDQLQGSSKNASRLGQELYQKIRGSNHHVD